MSKQPAGYPLRMPADLRAWFDAEAKKNGRSLNNEIVHCLRNFQARQITGQSGRAA